ncbi:xanthine dehydrogenase family protein molybdopterin-binding subunit [Micromonospora sp. NBC_00858]|uniref:xanthine dehydrogenase family protein molybdopterin-binding subunit n=1 Tax=Micromonospora sp. NBC_00858 TaxID=2975979 RepID=UPI0038638620|nr:xanthine dehydrogenase family protein molybdopterin-binding subunit [Micromonospora sp. NBC_00858]
MSLIGRPVRRTEDRALLTTGGTYVDDVVVPGCLELVFVRSPVAHGRLVGVDADAARTAPGVVAVFTAADVDLPPLPPEAGVLNQKMTTPVLADGVVRFVGEPVAAVLATSRAEAVDAAALVDLDIAPLPALVDVDRALADDLVLHPQAGTNMVLKLGFRRPAGRAELHEGADVVVRQRMRNPRVAPCPLEARAGQAEWGPDGLRYRAGSQAVHLWRGQLATALGEPEERVQVVNGDVGGAFGSKAFASREDVLVAWAGRRLGRPVRWAETRSESMIAAGHGRAQQQSAELGGTRDGRIVSYALEVVQDAGAYPRIGAILPFWTRTMLTGPYAIRRAKFSSSSVTTTTTPVVSYRGAGQPEAVAALERMVDLYAAEIGMDPAEVRRRNLLPPESFPVTTVTRARYDTGDYPAALERVLAEADYPALRAEQAARRARGDVQQLGIGLSTFVEITGADTRSEYASARVDDTGRFTVHSGTCPHGQGHVTAWAMIAADVLAVPMDRVDVRHSDTATVAEGGGTGGSRSLQTGGMAVREAALALVERGRDVAAVRLGVPRDEVEFTAGRFQAPGGRVVDWAELAADDAGPDGGLRVEATFQPSAATCPFGAHLAVAEVDTETGQVTLLRAVAVDDAGVLLNPLLAEGQVHGGLAQGAGQALVEEVRFAADGTPLHGDLHRYAMVGAAELPSFETVVMQTPTPVNALGAKGLGESGAVGFPPAVQNAVVDAVRHLGVRHIDMPVTAERVWAAIEAAGAAD